MQQVTGIFITHFSQFFQTVLYNSVSVGPLFFISSVVGVVGGGWCVEIVIDYRVLWLHYISKLPVLTIFRRGLEWPLIIMFLNRNYNGNNIQTWYHLLQIIFPNNYTYNYYTATCLMFLLMTHIFRSNYSHFSAVHQVFKFFLVSY